MPTFAHSRHCRSNHKVDVDAAHVRTEAEVERAVAGLAREQRVGLIVAADPYTGQHARSDFEIGRTAPRSADKPL